MTDVAGDGGFRCGPAARQAPRALAAAWILAAAVVAPAGPVGTTGIGLGLRFLVLAAGAVTALATLRGAREIRRVFRASEDGLEVIEGRASIVVPWKEIDSVTWEPALSRRSRWLPAVAFGRGERGVVRVPALVTRGGALVEEVLARSRNETLGAWAECHRARERLSRPGEWTVVVYAAAIALVAGAVWIRRSAGW